MIFSHFSLLPSSPSASLTMRKYPPGFSEIADGRCLHVREERHPPVRHLRMTAVHGLCHHLSNPTLRLSRIPEYFVQNAHLTPPSILCDTRRHRSFRILHSHRLAHANCKCEPEQARVPAAICHAPISRWHTSCFCGIKDVERNGYMNNDM